MGFLYSVLGNLSVVCLSVSLSPSRITGRRPVQIAAEEVISGPKAAIHGPKARLIMGRRPMYPWAKGPLTSPSKAAIHGPEAR